MGQSKTLERILSHVDDSYVTSLLQKLVSIPSINPPGRYEEIVPFIHDEISSYGIEVKHYEHYPKRPNLVAVVNGSRDGPTLLVDAHYDVVPPYDESRWTYPPFSAKIVDGVLHGRGSADCKASLAAMMAATRALVRSHNEICGKLILVAWADDEWRPTDSKWFNGESYVGKNGLIKADMAIFGEPYDMQLLCMSKGRVWFEFEVEGVASHSASGAGVNAILKAKELIDAIYGLKLGNHPIGGKDTVNVGTISGGDQTNMVPDRCKLTFDIRFSPPLTTRKLEDMVAKACKTLAEKDHEFKLKSSKVTERLETVDFPADGLLAKAIKAAGRTVLGFEPKVGAAVSFGDVSDWRDTIGLKEACMFGPGKTSQAHALNEHVVMSEVIQATKVYALAFAELLGNK
jgi:succinyl-diaminopimelate desuccinylase